MRIKVNGIELYYVKRGTGSPFVLLHGNGQDHTIYGALIRRLSRHYTVYAIDSRDHGKSSRVKYLSYLDKMKDTAAFIEALDLRKPLLYGFSDGGIIGILLAIYHPDILSKLIISGANTHPDGIKRPMLALIKIGYFFTRSNKLKLMLTQPDITDEQLRTITTPTMVLAGRHDIIKQKHTENIASNIPGSILWIINGEGHQSYLMSSDKLYMILEPFINEGFTG